MPLYDYIYADLSKVISLYSQLTGGIVESRETTQEQARSSDNKRNYDFKVFRHDAGGTENKLSGVRELIKPHHAVLAELEEQLTAQGYLIDLSKLPVGSLRDANLRRKISSALCIKVEGRAVIEDYERIKGIAGAFPEVQKLINRSIESGIKDNAEYKNAQEQLSSLRVQAKSLRDRNARAVKETELKRLAQELDAVVKARTSDAVDQWVLDGLKTWIDTFLPGITNLRVYPHPESPDEQVFGHLKKSYFEDQDSSSFHFTYGSVPTESISLLGIVTSVPREDSDTFAPLAEFERDELANQESVEKAFRGMFRGFDGLEQMIRTCRFPRILVQPLVVYRSVDPKPIKD